MASLRIGNGLTYGNGIRISGRADHGYTQAEVDALVGPDGPSVLANDFVSGGELRAQLVTNVSSGTLNFYPDGSFDYTATEAGTVEFTYVPLLWDVATQGVFTVTLTTGAGGTGTITVGGSVSLSTSDTVTLVSNVVGVITVEGSQSITTSGYVVISGLTPSDSTGLNRLIRNKWQRGRY